LAPSSTEEKPAILRTEEAARVRSSDVPGRRQRHQEDY